MNQKGNVAMIATLIIAAIIGVVVLNSLTSTFCNCTPDTTAEKNVTTNVWNNYTCTGTKCATDYSLECDGDTLVVGNDYSINGCDYRMENNTYNQTLCTLHYTYEGDNYNDGILATIVCLLPVLAAVGILLLAITWAVLK